jgi:hypothetical protein
MCAEASQSTKGIGFFQDSKAKLRCFGSSSGAKLYSKK